MTFDRCRLRQRIASLCDLPASRCRAKYALASGHVSVRQSLARQPDGHE